jgi:class 3 adenylate cyclase
LTSRDGGGGRERYGEVLRKHNEVLRSAFGAHDGIEVDRQGDAFFFVFRSAGTAIAAVAAKRSMAEADWPDDGARAHSSSSAQRSAVPTSGPSRASS